MSTNRVEASVETRTTHVVRIHLNDLLANLNLDPMDNVEIQFTSNARNKLPAPIKLSYSALARLVRDVD